MTGLIKQNQGDESKLCLTTSSGGSQEATPVEEGVGERQVVYHTSIYDRN